MLDFNGRFNPRQDVTLTGEEFLPRSINFNSRDIGCHWRDVRAEDGANCACRFRETSRFEKESRAPDRVLLLRFRLPSRSHRESARDIFSERPFVFGKRNLFDWM